MDRETTIWLFVAVCVAILFAFSYWEYRKNAQFSQRMKQLRPPRTSYGEFATAQIVRPSQDKGAFQNTILFITDKEILLYAEKGSDEPLISFRSDEIIGYWRPRPYHSDLKGLSENGWRSRHGNNEVNIHVNNKGRWVIVKLWVKEAQAKKIVNRLKGMVNEDILRSYRQRPPYIYHPPSTALLMSQDIYGMWHEDHRFKLYLTPSTLGFLTENDDEIERSIPLRNIQNIRLLEQKGEGGKDGLISFDLMGADEREQIAVAVNGSDKWARSIARAARRTLSDPVERKQKDKFLLEAEWGDDVFDLEAWEEQEYVLGDDGELNPVNV
jgi:curved DNA-binding protein CbpA